MKRRLLLLLAVTLLAGYLGTLIARDPGYVLIAYDGARLQTSLWVLLGLLIVAGLLVYALVRLLGLFFTYRGWRRHQRTARADGRTERGLALLAEGEFQRACRFLKGDAGGQGSSGLNYLAAARAANGAGDHDARETCLRMAEAADAGLSRACAVVAAELALERDEPETALNALKGIKTNAHVARLKQQALRRRQDWRQMMAAVPELRALDPALERDAALAGFRAERGKDATLHELYRSLSGELKQSPEILVAYVESLTGKAGAEPALRSAIRKSWQPALVECYGEGEPDTLKVRMKTATTWLKEHPDDAALQFCLGRLHELAGARALARDAFNRCIELGGTRKANERLGLLLAESGDFERGHRQLSIALQADQGSSDQGAISRSPGEGRGEGKAV